MINIHSSYLNMTFNPALRIDNTVWRHWSGVHLLTTSKFIDPPGDYCASTGQRVVMVN